MTTRKSGGNTKTSKTTATRSCNEPSWYGTFEIENPLWVPYESEDNSISDDRIEMIQASWNLQLLEGQDGNGPIRKTRYDFGRWSFNFTRVGSRCVHQDYSAVCVQTSVMDSFLPVTSGRTVGSHLVFGKLSTNTMFQASPTSLSTPEKAQSSVNAWFRAAYNNSQFYDPTRLVNSLFTNKLNNTQTNFIVRDRYKYRRSENNSRMQLGYAWHLSSSDIRFIEHQQ